MAVQTAADRHALDTEIRNTLLSDMLGMGCSYWADITDIVEGNNHMPVTITLIDREDDSTYTVHRDGFGIAVDDWARRHVNCDNRFAEQFARQWTAMNYDYVDFDAGIADELLQHHLFGKRVYA